MTSKLLPPITIVMTTWASDSDVGRSRAESAYLALVSWRKHLLYDGEGLRLCISDDGSALPGYPAELAQVADKRWPVDWTRQERKGVGASLNAGMRAAFAVSPLVLYAVDDWALTADLDLTPWAEALMEMPDIGMVRLGPPHPGLTGTVAMVPDGWVLKLDRHHFADGLRPFLAHQRFFEAYGPYDEGQSSYECERLHNLRYAHASEGPLVVLALPHPWAHVGEAEVGEMAPGDELLLVEEVTP